jgi:hypothetical protein
MGSPHCPKLVFYFIEMKKSVLYSVILNTTPILSVANIILIEIDILLFKITLKKYDALRVLRVCCVRVCVYKRC